VARLRAISLLLILLAGACRDWRERVDPALAQGEPEQVPLPDAEPPIELELKDHHVRLKPRATYRITGYAADTSRVLLDQWDFVVPMDVALVWGPVADPAVLRHMQFHLSERYVSFWYDGETPHRAVGRIPTHVANNHLIPASEEVAAAMKRIRQGDLVTLQGKLVDLEISDAAGRIVHKAATSLRRDDVGSGACEQIWVESVQIGMDP
jgi:hypothetical protein